MVVALILALSPFQAALRSLILPGWGQASMGAFPKSTWVVETALGLGTFLAWEEGRRAEDRARMFALRNARPEGSITRRFFDLAEAYETFEAYRNDLYRQARDLYPGDIEAQTAYVNSRLPGFRWAWPDRNTWFAYADLRGLARTWGNRTRVLVGLLVAHHVVSALDAYFRARDAGVSLSFQTGPQGEARLQLSRTF